MKPKIEGMKLWHDFGDIPIDDDENIDEDFHIFPKGTNRYDIFHWFEETFEDFVVGLVINAQDEDYENFKDNRGYIQ